MNETRAQSLYWLGREDAKSKVDPLNTFDTHWDHENYKLGYREVATEGKEKGYIRDIVTGRFWGKPGAGTFADIECAHVYTKEEFNDINRSTRYVEFLPMSRATTAATTTEFSSAVDFINKAAEYVGGDRAKTHGDKGLNFRTTGILHKALDDAIEEAGSNTPEDLKFALKMILAKLSRILSGSYNPDDYVDIAGYAGCAGEVAAQHASRED